ncbi:MAG: oxidoreductase, partial [Caulobacteraceae bacterium]|nr:oxidoreductase [Caulobacteraceae bacterium]
LAARHSLLGSSPVQTSGDPALTYAIIGSGAIGSALARAFARARQPVLVANSRGPESLIELTSALDGVVQAVELKTALAAEVVLLAVPFNSAPKALSLATAWNGRILVDATNAIDFPAFTPRDLGSIPSTRIVAEAAPGARVVKAFNTIPAAILAQDPAEGGGHRVVFVSGDEETSIAEVAALVGTLGFAPIVLGALDQGGRQQAFGGPLVGHNLLRKA